MKFKSVVLTASLLLLLFIGCTACDSGPKESDITGDRTVLTGSRWIAQEIYSIDAKIWGVLAANASGDTNNLFSINFYENPTTSRVAKTATLTYTGDTADLSVIIAGAEHHYTLRITSSREGQITLSLTDVDDANSKLFFSPEV
jgi:hypothetical protein